ncbi:MAG: SRPBCC family protein [Nitrospiria bacterium]
MNFHSLVLFFALVVLIEPGRLTAEETSSHLNQNVSLEFTQTDWPMTFSAQIEIPAPRGTIWEVLTDYDHWIDFLPQLESSQIIRRIDERIIVELVSREHFWFFFKRIEVTLRVLERSMEEISFFKTGGNMEVFSGRWILNETERGKSTRLTYLCALKPSFYAPKWMIRYKLDQDIPDLLHLISERAEKLNSK